MHGFDHRAVMASRAGSLRPDLDATHAAAITTSPEIRPVSRPTRKDHDVSVPRRRSVLTSLALTCALMFVASSPVFAHTAWFTIWATGIDIWTGVTNHYDNAPQCGVNCSYDYMMPMNAEVHQSVAGDFIWEYLDLPAGNVFDGTNAFKGTMYVVGNQQIATSGAYYCTSVTQAAAFNLEALDNGASSGYWTMDSGGGSISCYGTYPAAADRQVVTAQ